MRWVALVIVFGTLVGLLVHDLGGTDGKPLTPEAPKHEAVEAAARAEALRLEQVVLVEARISAGRQAAHAEAVRVKAERERVRRSVVTRQRTATGTTTPSSSVNWDAIARCESNGRWNLNTGNGYLGGLQWSLSTWRSAGGQGMPHHASREAQIAAAERLIRGSRSALLHHWPTCGRFG